MSYNLTRYAQEAERSPGRFVPDRGHDRAEFVPEARVISQLQGGRIYPRSDSGFSGEPVFFSIFESAYEKLMMNLPYLVWVSVLGFT